MASRGCIPVIISDEYDPPFASYTGGEDFFVRIPERFLLGRWWGGLWWSFFSFTYLIFFLLPPPSPPPSPQTHHHITFIISLLPSEAKDTTISTLVGLEEGGKVRELKRNLKKHVEKWEWVFEELEESVPLKLMLHEVYYYYYFFLAFLSHFIVLIFSCIIKFIIFSLQIAAIGDIAAWKYKMEKKNKDYYIIPASHVRKKVVDAYYSQFSFSFPPSVSFFSWLKEGLWGGGE